MRLLFFVGENGSGKSTLLEALAVAANSVTIGAGPAATDETLLPARKLARYLELRWKLKKQRGFFLRAEDFFNFVKEQAKLRVEMLQNIAEVERTYQHRSELAKSLAKSPYQKSLAEMESRYGEDLDANSHGESFLQVFFI